MADENRIVRVMLTLQDNGNIWDVAVLKQFAPEYGGGEETFRETGGASIHRALDVARQMVTLSPGSRTDAAIDPMKRIADFEPREDRTTRIERMKRDGYLGAGWTKP